MAHSQLFYDVGRFEFSIYEVDPYQGFMQLDIRPFETSERDIALVLFGGKDLTAKLSGFASRNGILKVDYKPSVWIGYVRWRISWNWNTMHFASLLRDPFFKMMVRAQHKPGWLDADIKREAMMEAWRITPQECYGGYAPRDFAAKGGGAFEIKSFGFVWIGSEQAEFVLQSRPYFKDAALNNDIRWYLEHGASLGEAIRLMRQQWHEVSIIAITSFASAMGGMSGIGGINASRNIPGTVQQALNSADTARKLTNEFKLTDVKTRPGELNAADFAQNAMNEGRNEARIQKLAGQPVRALQILQRRNLANDQRKNSRSR